MSIENFFQHLKNVWADLQEPIINLNGSKISIISISFSLLAIIITWWVSKIVGKLVGNWLKRSDVDVGVRNSMEKFTRYSLFLLGVLLALDNMGVSINSLAAVGAVLMVGIGFGLQNLAQNFISGIILLIERPIKVGDIIQVGTTTGRVVDIRVRATMVETRDDVTIIVPNSRFISEEVLNQSYSGSVIRQNLKVGVGYNSDVPTVQRILCEAALEHPEVLQDPPPIVLLKDFGESSLDFELFFSSSELWRINLVTAEIRVKALNKFREAKIELPFPQRDVRILTQTTGN